jgi:leucyl/phenylalanyl-tRNA--protein transferase
MSANRVQWLSPGDPPEAFPDTEFAMREPDGLLAAGGDLSVERLLYAYSKGIFPWFDDGQPILWWAPDPRCDLLTRDFRTSSRMRREMRQSTACIRVNQAFSEVIRACAAPRRSQQGTWITTGMISAYESLHEQGWAHSIEVWDEGNLVGGMYGIAIDHVFFGESMFSETSNASKLAMLGLCEIMAENGVDMIDCQVVSSHLTTLGAITVPRQEFTAHLASACAQRVPFVNWPESAVPVRDIEPK